MKRELVRRLQFRVFGFGLFKDWEVGVCILPQLEEILIIRLCFRGITLSECGTGKSEVRECGDRFVQRHSRIVEYPLKVG